MKESAGDSPSVKLLGDLKILASDMSAVPSLKIRGMVERANKCPDQTSVQLLETLENAGLIDGRKGAGVTLSLYRNIYGFNSAAG